MHIKLKEKLRFNNARKYKAIKFKLRCDYNVNMNWIMLTVAINVRLVNWNTYIT